MDRVTWTDSAIQDLNDLGDYISKNSEKYAQITVKRLFDSVNILESYPFSGKIIPEFNNISIRELIRGNYRIVYQIINENRIDILTVHNCAMLLENSYNFSDINDD
ncbi:MAG: type II toxin-antitoxin system RelE/ParE family toxin [Bacteroidetes bacterium]|nr:type II toxin-antitoxin system RelE/ParE family toxin [Bacteroidota bacterium]